MAHLLTRVLPTLAKAAVTLLLLGLLLRKTDYAAILQHLRDITPVPAFVGLSVLYAGLGFAAAHAHPNQDAGEVSETRGHAIR